MKKPVLVTIDEEILEKLKNYNMFKRIKLSAFINDLLINYYKNNKKDIDTINDQYEDLFKKIIK